MSSGPRKLFFADSAGFAAWLETLLGECSVFAPVEREGSREGEPDYVFRRMAEPSAFCFNPYRTLEPLKGFFTPYRERVAEYFGGGGLPAAGGETVVFGVKACDIQAHRVQDYIFLEGVEPDSFYRARRENTIIVSGDCPDFKEVCFCMAMGGAPYPASGFDLNLSPMEGGYLVEAGSERGEGLIGRNPGCFSEASEEMLVRREDDRRGVSDRLFAHLEPKGLPRHEGLQEMVRKSMNSDTWGRFALTCVECGACNFACDTCHCFLLAEGAGDELNTKTRLWDSCQYKNFARVAGGANPMKTRAERLRNRFLKKFDFFVDNMKTPACCGCGRCVEACPGEIDIREMLKDIARK